MIEKIIEYLNSLSDVQIIPAYTMYNPPAKPYATYYPLSYDSTDHYGAKYREGTVEKTDYRIIAQIQFDIFAGGYKEALKKAVDLRELILFNVRRDLHKINVGIVNSTGVRGLTEKINDKYDYRASFDVKFEYMKTTKEREIELVKTVDLLINNRKEKIGG